MKEESKFQSLFKNFTQVGEVVWIGVRPARRAAMRSLKEVHMLNYKLEGDHYNGKPESKRQVTFIQEEHISVISSFLGKNVGPEQVRRNIVVKGINLLSFKDKKFRMGAVVFEMTGLCHPCSRMEENLGFGGYNAMRGHGGITARIVEPGLIKVGDKVEIFGIEEII